MRRYAGKFIAFGLVIYFIIPSSVLVGSAIEGTYQETIESSIAAAEEATEEIPAEDKNLLEKIADKVTGGVSAIVEKFTISIKNMIEAMVIMLITTCLIPIATIFIFAWIIKFLFGIDVGAEKRLLNLKNKMK